MFLQNKIKGLLQKMYISPVSLWRVPEFAKWLSVLSDTTSKIWADFAKDWHKIGILQ